MATIFKFYDGTNTLDLSGAGVMTLGHDYRPVVAEILGDGSDPASVIEALPVQIDPSSVDNLAATVQAADLLRKAAAEYRQDPTQAVPVWFHQQINGETGERRALLEKLDYALDYNPYATRPTITERQPGSIAATRRPYWERASARDLPEATPGCLNFDSGSEEPSPGDTITGQTSGNSGVLQRVIVTSGTWVGGDAAGTLFFSDTDGAFSDNEALDISGGNTDVMTADGTRKAGASMIYDYTAAGSSVAAHDIVGDVGARIEEFQLKMSAGTNGFYDAWMGIRTAGKHGTLANFAHIWECENGANTARSSDAVDALCSGGNTVEGTPSAGDTWEEYFMITLANAGVAAGDEDDNFGNFLWLLRTKVDAGCTFEVQLRFGYSSFADAEFVRGPIVEVTSTSYKYFALGLQSIPLIDRQTFAHVSAAEQSTFAIQVFARRTAGSDKIYFDCLCPLPIDEGFLMFDSAGGATVADYIRFSEAPNGKVGMTTSIAAATNYIHQLPVYEQRFRLPPGDGRMYIVAQASASTLTDIMTLNSSDVGKYYERWAALRGAE